MVRTIGHLEASIDFVEQDILPSEYKHLQSNVENMQKSVKDLIQSYDVGRNLSQGTKVLLIGPANVGKSSLFNALVKQNKAIVTEIPGTTRDLVTDQVFIGNLSFEFTDSAGLRQSQDVVEKMGIKKTHEQINSSDILLVVLDATKNNEVHFLKDLPKEKCFFIFNKMDLLSGDEFSIVNDWNKNRFFKVSATKGMGIEELVEGLQNYVAEKNHSDDPDIVTQPRHFNLLNRIMSSLSECKKLFEKNESPDLISQELHQALKETHSLLGKTYDDEVLDMIFSEFCIGK